MEKCERCQALTKDGNVCTRKASCKLGCKYVCWQHAAIYEKGKYCEMTRIPPCRKPGHDPSFPCRSQDKIYWNESQFEKKYGRVEDDDSEESLTLDVPKCTKKALQFPCIKKNMYFGTRAEYDEYLTLKVPGEYKRSKRKKIAKRANKEIRKETKKSKKKPVVKTPIRKVKFNL